MKQQLLNLAKTCGADLMGVAPATRFAPGHKIFRIYPQVKSVVGFVFRCLRGSYRGVEEGSTYYQYTTMSVENLEETVMPVALVRVANLIESRGFTAVPQRRHQTIMESNDGTNPEVDYVDIVHDRPQEPQFDFIDAAVLCGLGEKGFHGALLTDDFGPMQRVCFLLTDAELEPDPVVAPHLCDKCGECAKGCPGHCVAADGKIDPWRCAAYYNGANGQKNPFMPPDAFPDFEDRLKIIAGEARVTPEKARMILDKLFFYPPIKHAYQSSICGRACDRACMAHLEEQRKIVSPARTKFRKHPEWKLQETASNDKS